MAMFGSAGTTEILEQSLCCIAGVGAAPVFVTGGVLVATLFPRELELNSFAVAVYFGGGGLGMLSTGLVLPNYLNSHFPNWWQMLLGLMALVSSIMLGIVISATFQIKEAHCGTNLRLSGLRAGIMRPATTAYFLFGLGYIIYMTFLVLVSWLRVNGADVVLISAIWSLLGVAVMASPFMWRKVLSQTRAARAIALTTLTLGLAALFPLFVNEISVFLFEFMFGGAMFMVPTSATNFAKASVAQTVMGAAVALFTVFFPLARYLDQSVRDVCLMRPEMPNGYYFLEATLCFLLC